MISSFNGSYLKIKSLRYSILFVLTISIPLVLQYSLNIPLGVTFLFAIIIFTSSFIPSIYSLQRIAVSSVLVIGLSPFYLLARGFVTDARLNSADLYIYGLAFLICSALIKLPKNRVFQNIKYQIKELKGVLFGFSGLIVAFGLECYMLSKSLGAGVSWVSSGDSKNHLVAAASLVSYGDLLPSTFLTQPINLPSTLSLLLAQVGSDVYENPNTLGAQMEIYAFFWSLLIGLMGISMAASAQVIAEKNQVKISKLTYILLSIIPFSSLILGPALNDGFFTAIFGITTLTVMTSWFMEINQIKSENLRLLIIGIFIFFSTLMSWMFIVAVTLPLLMFGIRNYLIRFIGKSTLINLSFILSILLMAYIIFVSKFGLSFQARVKIVLSADGAVTTSSANFYYFLIFSLGALGFLLSKITNKNKSILAICSIHIIALMLFKFFSNLSLLGWNYYLLKYQWIMASALLGLFVAYLLMEIDLIGARNKMNTSFISLLIFTGLTALSASVTPENVGRVVPKILRGWENPRGSIMNFALSQDLDNQNPTMMFHYGYAGDARLANFWMNAFSSPQDPIRGWNYTIDTSGDPKQLCDVNAYYPKVTVITSDSKLEQDLARICPIEEFVIRLEPSPI